MTSSLVGSEMCIRDRTVSLTEPQKTQRSVNLSHPRQQEETQARGYEPPVSYTHLTLPTICSV
eukprot:7966747-Prorocentrum_lima.AAC.1